MNGPGPWTLEGIITLAKEYAGARRELDLVVQDIEKRRRLAVRSRIRALKARVADTAAAREALEQAVRENPQLFVRPKTQAADGVKFGFQKKAGSIDIADEAEVIRLIRDKLKTRAAQLIRTKETLDKTALRKLSAGDLAKLGLSVGDPTNQVTITVPKTDIDAIVDALMRDAGDGTEGEE